MAKTGKQPDGNRKGLQGEKLSNTKGKPDSKEPAGIIATGNNDNVPGRSDFSEGGVGVRIGGGDEK